MVISSTNKKNPEEKMEKKILKEDDDGKKCLQKIISHPPSRKITVRPLEWFYYYAQLVHCALFFKRLFCTSCHSLLQSLYYAV